MNYNVGNKFALGNKGGQPSKYDNADDLSERIGQYFAYIQGEREEQKEGEEKIKWIRYPESPTITGLALFLGFQSRQSIYDNIEKDEYSYILKRAVTVIENHHEERMDSTNVAGSIFVLKNMGWKDKSEHNHNIKGEFNYTTEERNKKIKELLDKKDAE